MHADLQGVLDAIKEGKKAWRFIEHRGKPLTKEQCIKVFEYGIKKGYTSTKQFTDDEVDKVLTPGA